jgi:ribonuclease HII
MNQFTGKQTSHFFAFLFQTVALQPLNKQPSSFGLLRRIEQRTKQLPLTARLALEEPEQCWQSGLSALARLPPRRFKRFDPSKSLRLRPSDRYNFLRSMPKASKTQPDRLEFERDLWSREFTLVAGVDEAGRGPLAGPVVAAAVILPATWAKECARPRAQQYDQPEGHRITRAPQSRHVAVPGDGHTPQTDSNGGFDERLVDLNDSKQLTESQRENFFQILTTHPDLRYAIAIVDAATIDRINILQATHRAMNEALAQLQPQPQHVLVDGRQVKSMTLPQTALVKGDSRSYSIAAASVLAKVTRDRMMLDYDAKFPGYGFAIHKGYGVPQHLAAIEKLGPCPIHRMSFAPLKQKQAQLL